MGRTGAPAVRTLAAVHRATAVLDALGAAGGELGTSEISRRTGINASTVSRLLATLASAGYVEHLPDTGRYRLGARVLQLANAVLARLDVRALARPALEDLVERHGETATLSLPAGAEAVTADFVAGRAGTVISVARVGRPSVAHATAVGKVVLAFGRDGLAAIERYPTTAYTARTITEEDALRREVEAVQAAGTGHAVGEREPDLNAVAVPVFDARGDLAAVLGLQGPAVRFTPAAMEEALPTLVRAGRDVSRALGA